MHWLDAVLMAHTYREYVPVAKRRQMEEQRLRQLLGKVGELAA